MKPTSFLALAAAILSISVFSSPRAAAQYELFESEPHGSVRTVTSAPVPWSVIGQWHYAGSAWRGLIDIRADGTFSRAGDGQAGKWKLGGAEDNFVLILKWNHFPQDTVEFINPTLFRGDSSKGETIIRRLPTVAAAGAR